jgi:CSLREA domain-containing protein
LTYQVTSGTLIAPDGFTGALSRELGEAVGSYAITQGNLSLSSDYALTYAGANLTILSNELTVTKAGDTNDGVCDNDCSLREAIDVIPNGGTIHFDASLAGQTVTLSSTLLINKDLTIDGSALTSRVRISGNNAVTVFEIASGTVATLKGMTITDGRATEDDGAVLGGGIKNYGTLHISSSMISNNIADPLLNGNGGGIYNAGYLDINASVISNNSAYFGGGIQNFGESLIIRDSNHSDNVAGEGGGV